MMKARIKITTENFELAVLSQKTIDQANKVLENIHYNIVLAENSLQQTKLVKLQKLSTAIINAINHLQTYKLNLRNSYEQFVDINSEFYKLKDVRTKFTSPKFISLLIRHPIKTPIAAYRFFKHERKAIKEYKNDMKNMRTQIANLAQLIGNFETEKYQPMRKRVA